MLYDDIRRNKRTSFLIILFFIGFIVFLTWIYGVAMGLREEEQISILGISGAVAFFSAFVGYYSSMQVALMATGAKEVERAGEFLELHRIIENLAITAGVPKPKVCVIDDPSPNAFATGRDPEHAAVAVTTGLLRMLTRTELEGVLAHELSHIRNYDIRLGTIVVVFVGIVAMLGDIMQRIMWHGGGNRDDRKGNGILLIIAVVFMIISPIIAKLIQLAVSRQREYLADASGAELTRYPEGLASALEKITSDDTRMRTAGTATAHLFISSPFSDEKEKSFFKEWFSTHPDPEKRVSRLREMFGVGH
jgi:heat shock protein HtpX